MKYGNRDGVALVTGGSGGLGKEIVTALASAGLHVCVGYHSNKEVAEHIAEDVTRNSDVEAVALKIDASNSGAAAKTVAEAERCLGPLSVLVNAAGINVRQQFLEVSEAALHQVFDTNVICLYLMCQAVVRRIVEDSRPGRVVNVSSIASGYALGDRSVYEASKAAVDRITMSLAYELAPLGVTVNAVAPGLVETAMTLGGGSSHLVSRTRAIPMGRMGRAEEVAQAVRFFAVEAPSYITGTVLPVDGGRLTC